VRRWSTPGAGCSPAVPSRGRAHEHGTEIYRTFVFDVCGCHEDWDRAPAFTQVVADIRRVAGDRRSSPSSAARRFHRRLALCARALGPERVLGLYVDTGFMREGDAEAMQYLKSTVARRAVRLADRSADFFARLRGVTHPEDKRAIIGETFIAVQEDEFARWVCVRTSGCSAGDDLSRHDRIGWRPPRAKIKTHHNRV